MEPQFVIDVIVLMALYDLTKHAFKLAFKCLMLDAEDKITVDDDK
jgi:hypothetical protein